MQPADHIDPDSPTGPRNAYETGPNYLAGTRRAEIEVSISLPWDAKAQRFIVPLDLRYIESLAPLPRNHDAPFDPWAMADARGQREERERVIKELSDEMVSHIRQMITRIIRDGDPIRGYTAEERRAMQEPPTGT